MPRRLDPDAFVAELIALAGTLEEGERRLVALAGPPGSGKSTLTERILGEVNEAHPGSADVLPMDGFHYDDEVLVSRGWRARKGAPHTFDVAGLLAMLDRLSGNEEDEIAVPRFDRSLEIARAGARLIPRDVRLVLVEGNYLLLCDPPWDRLANAFHLTALIRVEEAELRRRLRQRWEGAGLDEATVLARLEDNDLPNGRLVMTKSRPADVEIA